MNLWQFYCVYLKGVKLKNEWQHFRSFISIMYSKSVSITMHCIISDVKGILLLKHWCNEEYKDSYLEIQK